MADIEEMEIQDAVLLLLKSAQQSEYTDNSQESAKQIVQALGFLPLAIDQAGAYIHMAPCPLHKYLDVFNEQKEILLRSPRFKGGDEQRHIAVYATFNISYKAIKAFADKNQDMARVKDAEVALKLLNLICFYNHEGNIHAIFDQAAKMRYETDRASEYPLKAGDLSLDDLVWTFETDITPENPDGRAWDSNDYSIGLTFLHEFSLIKVDFSTAYSNMHVLVHDWARSRMGDEERSDWGLAARCILMDSIGLNPGLHHVVYRRDVAPHLEACQKYVKAEHDDLALESEYQGKMAMVFQQASNLEAAEFALTKALEYRKKTFGLLSVNTFSAMSQLAEVYVRQGHYGKAEDLLREAIDRRVLLERELIWEATDKALTATGEGNDQNTVVIPNADEPLDNSRILKDTKRLINALVLQDQKEAAANLCLEIQKWYERGDGKEAKVRVWRRLVSNLRGESVEDDLTIQEAMQQLANTEALLGPTSTHTIRDKKTLAKALAQHGGYVESQKIYMEVLEWTKRAYGEESIEVFNVMEGVANMLFKQARYFEADKVYLAVEAKYADVLGPQHPKTLQAKSHLAMCLYARTAYDEAVRLMQACLEGRRVVLGPQHTLTLQSEHCVRQFREMQATAPDWLDAGLRNRAMQASLDALGDSAPEWMRRWEPESEEALMRAHLERGTLRRYKLEIVTEPGDLVFTRLHPLELVGQPQTLEMTLEQSTVENDEEN